MLPKIQDTILFFQDRKKDFRDFVFKISKILLKISHFILHQHYLTKNLQIDLKYIPESSIRFGLVEQKFYQITAIDEYTRKRVLKVVEEKSSYETSLFLEGLEEKFGFPIQVIQTDNGKEFTNDSKEKLSAFELELSKRKIVHERIRPYSPWQNGKVERSHRGDSAYYARQRFYSREELEKKVERYCHRYNNVAKKVLGFKSPNEVLEEYRREKKVELS